MCDQNTFLWLKCGNYYRALLVLNQCDYWLLRIHNGLISILKEHVNFDAPSFSRGMSVVIWFAPWPPVRESRVRIRLPHRNLTKFILVWLFFKKRYSSTSGLLSFKKPETVLWTIAKNYYYYYYLEEIHFLSFFFNLHLHQLK